MNWKSKSLIYRKDYFKDIKNRRLDIVLIDNPNPTGMLVRVLRHLDLKDAVKISKKASEYLKSETQKYTYIEFNKLEKNSYKIPVVSEILYNYFKNNRIDYTAHNQSLFDEN